MKFSCIQKFRNFTVCEGNYQYKVQREAVELLPSSKGTSFWFIGQKNMFFFCVVKMLEH